MNNYQWLLQMDGAERKAWFDAEHVETEERALDGDTAALEAKYGKGGVVGGSFCDTPEQGEVVMPLESWREYLGAESENEDSREKLEADAKRYIEHAADYAYEDVLWAGETFTLYDAIIELLDRQRAIDDSICDECSSDYYEMQEEHDQMIDGIAKLMRLKQPYTFDPGKPLENIETIGRYIDELTAELEKATNNLNSANEDFENARAELTAERDKLQEQLLIGWECECRLQAERERYRSKFGKCLDYADAIHALMDDEGIA